MARRHSRGQGLVEYALMLGLIAAVAIGGLFFLGGHIKSSLSNTGTRIGTPVVVNNGGNNGNDDGNNDDHGGGRGGGHGNGH